MLGIEVLLKFVGSVHLSTKGKMIGSTLLLLKSVSGPYPKRKSTSASPTSLHLLDKEVREGGLFGCEGFLILLV